MREVYILRGVEKIYGRGEAATHALRGVDLEIYERECVAIVGPSGSGKTTLLSVMGLLDKPTKGEVFFLGRDILKLTDAEASKLRARYIGFVFQTFNLVPWLSALENVELAMSIIGISPAVRRKKALELLTLVDLAHRVEHKPTELSGGEQQRVAIARALANDPLVILADEPTGNLDSKSGMQVVKILKDLTLKGKTVVIVTHNMDIARMADRVVKLRDGKVVEVA
ncbi:MAG: ABC transporter ATP-binding protein [Candidatus Verstraetearchaeota archaeon]|nr:ABC transporter ATP-binding protein [Candidatus Verstraetearchaeota archaeon]